VIIFVVFRTTSFITSFLLLVAGT